MKFKYKRYSPEIIRPVIPVEIAYRDNSIGYEVLVDSGADACIFDAEIGEVLGIDITKGECREVGGITGVSEFYYIHSVTIIVGGWSYDIKAGFLPNIARLGHGVVGQTGFFENFIVRFDHAKEEIELRPRVKQ